MIVGQHFRQITMTGLHRRRRLTHDDCIRDLLVNWLFYIFFISRRYGSTCSPFRSPSSPTIYHILQPFRLKSMKHSRAPLFDETEGGESATTAFFLIPPRHGCRAIHSRHLSRMATMVVLQWPWLLSFHLSSSGVFCLWTTAETACDGSSAFGNESFPFRRCRSRQKHLLGLSSRDVRLERFETYGQRTRMR